MLRTGLYIASFEDEDPSQPPPPTEGVEDLFITDGSSAPSATIQRISRLQGDFVQFEAPCLIGAASEDGANVSSLPYFDTKAFLAQSPNFTSNSKFLVLANEYMTEFTGLDMEMEIEEYYHEVRDMIEGLMLYIFRGLEDRCKEQIELIRVIYSSDEFILPEPGKEVRLTFAEGQKLLREEGPEKYRNKFNIDFDVLDKFPEGARPFYTLEDLLNSKVTNAYDFSMRG
ncbi:hypothetical protein F5X99DRAFT_410452 [Biscogniauxia marginata]|nr:hypothetical protein F5X99DRAFT_410452 [Biscogniauxia marginata]